MQALPAALAAMAAYPQFILYKLVPERDRPGKTKKIPINHLREAIDPHNPAHWMRVEMALSWAAYFGEGYGAGFVFTDNDPFWFLDIDEAFQDGKWSDLSIQLCQAFAGCAVEVSQSMRGLHIFGSGPVPHHGCDNSTAHLGFYHRARFVALTGLNAIGDCRAHARPECLEWLVRTFFAPEGMTPGALAPGSLMQQWDEACRIGPVPEWRGPAEDDELIRRARMSKSATSEFGGGICFADLWDRNIEALARRWPGDSGEAYNASEADSALAQRLAFWTGRDAARIERLMRASALSREKWDRDDYLPRTILGCIARQRDVLTDKTPEPVALMPEAGPGHTGQASEHRLVAGATYLSAADQIAYFAGCVYVADQHRVLAPNGTLYRPEQFNVIYGGKTFTLDNENQKVSDKAFDALTQNKAFVCARADTSRFRPDLPPGAIVAEPGQTYVNTYIPLETPRQVGDVSPFLDHLRRVLPHERDQVILLSYMAAIVQHKGVKFQWAPVLQGVEGNGKTMFSRCVAFAIGSRYTYYPTARDLADRFNDWMVNKIFIGVEDVYVPENQWEIMEALKPMVTNSEQQIQGKGKDKYTGWVCCNWMLNMNDPGGLPITDKSRRYAPFFCAQQTSLDLIRDGMNGEYFPRLYRWLQQGGYAIVSELLHTYPIAEEFNPAGACHRAPATSSTPRALEAGRSGLEQDILEAVRQERPGFAGGWISSIWLQRLLEARGDKRVTIQRRTTILEGLGYVKHPSLADGMLDSVVLPDAARPRLFAKLGSAAEQFRGTSAEVAAVYSAAQQNAINVM